MAAILTRLSADLRSRWRAWAAVALMIGVAGAVVLTTTAGARRTDTAYDRFLVSSHAAELLVSPDQTGFPHFYRDLAEHTDGTVTPVIGYGVTPIAQPDHPILVVASNEPRFGTSVERPKITAGRLPRADDAYEVLADLTAARALHLRPGSRLQLRVAKRDEELPRPTDQEITVTVVGVGVTRDNVATVNALATAPNLLGTPAFVRQFGPDHYAFDGAEIVLRPGASKSAFTATAQSIARRLPETGGNLSVADEAEQAAKVDHAIRPQAVALALFALLTALTALLAIGQVLARLLFLTSGDNSVLRALGMSRTQLLVIGLAEAAIAATLGALFAVVGAVVASPMMPIGPARLAEPHPGIAFDWLVLGAGFVAIIVLFVASVAQTAWRLTMRGNESGGARDRFARRPSAAIRWATAAGTPPNAAIGIGYAVDPGRGRSAVPARGAIVVTALAIAAIAAATTFGTNLSRLVGTPRLYGQSWDLTVDAQFSPLPLARIDSLLSRDDAVTAWTFGTHTDVNLGGQVVPGIALIRAHHGFVTPTIVAGAPAQRADEIMLGTKTLDRLSLRIGQTVTVALPRPGTQAPPRERLRIVGRGVFPFFGEGSFTPTGLGVGVQVTEPQPAASGPSAPVNLVLVRVAAGADRSGAIAGVERALSRARICGVYNQCTMSTTIRPTDVLNYARIQSTPLALSIVLVVLAVGVLTNLLVTSIRRRRRDLAVLKTLGFRRRQVSSTVAWQATTLVALALLIGLPIGTLLGRWVWTIFAGNLGVPGDPHTPLLALLVAIPVALVIANLIAAVPGLLARRTYPAVALRTE